MINKDSKNSVRLSLKGLEKTFRTLATYSSDEYLWKPDGVNGHPVRNLPPSTRSVAPDHAVTIPAWSIAVLR